MKVGKSVVQFNITCKKSPTGDKLTLQTVPYWSLYARKGDNIGPSWKSTRALTYDEVISYLLQCDHHRVLEAYPRFSKRTRDSYTVSCMHYSQYYDVVCKQTGEIIAEFNSDFTCHYIAEQHKHRLREHLLRVAREAFSEHLITYDVFNELTQR